MGVPHLIPTLEPYATHEVLQDADVVIDGPALAYHVLFICNREGIVQPSYELLGNVAVTWLQELVNRGIHVQAIYFDGHLPLAKRPVRMERMIKSLKQLRQFQSLHPKDCSLAYLSCSKDKLENVFTTKTPPGKPFLAPSFHVPAVIDALRASPRFQPLIRLVPGEADAYCAQHLLNKGGGTVLTSDSDLLAHDLGEGRVAFLRDIYLDGESRVTSAIFSPSQISERLGLPSRDLRRFAYERKSSSHLTLPQIIRECKQAIRDEAGYRDFCQEYLDHETAILPTSTQGKSLSIECLDPRLSELILQLELTSHDAPSLQEGKLFLPILIEDTLRGSAWEHSTPIRQLAYTIARWTIPGASSSVQEYRRVNMPTQKGREVQFLPRAAAKQLTADLTRLMAQVQVEPKTDERLRWLMFCLILDIRECYDQGKESHALRTLQQSSESPPRPSGRVSWGTIHFSAQVQASYYSLRVLQQVLSMTEDGDSSKDLLGLRNMLSFLPQLSHFPTLEQIVDFLRESKGQEILRIISKYVQIPQSSLVQVNQRLGSEKKRKAKNAQKESLGKESAFPAQTQTSRNPFHLLNED